MLKTKSMRRGIIAVIIVLLMALCFLLSNVAFVDAPVTADNDPVVLSSQELEIFSTDKQLTQDQAVSRIKAEYLKENGGYHASDNVVAIVKLKDDAVIDAYLNDPADADNLGEYALGKGAARVRSIKYNQSALSDKLIGRRLIKSVDNSYSTIINAISVTAEYGKLEEIRALPEVDAVILSDTYNLPQTADVPSTVTNNVDVYDTGIFNSGSVDFTGKGTAVAILDSGFDCSHSVFDRQPEGELWLTQQDISSKVSQTNAAKTTEGLDLNDVWYSNKIPFVYDYADKDKDVFPYDSEHGTHVAGIIGGKDSVITGVAVDTQLVLMKVFPDYNDGAETDDILAALEDAVLLGVDCINMSLGSSCGFSREEDGNRINDVYDKIEKSGISLLTAASNSYSSAFGGEQGNTNKVTNPDSSTVGSPSTYSAALSVASVSGVKSRYLYANGEQVVFFIESNSITGKPNDFVNELYESQGLDKTQSKTFEYVTIPGYGKRINYTGLDISGKIALVKRGENTFEDKALRAKNAGAIACIIYNNVEGDINMSMGKTDHIPTISISKEVGTALAAHETGTLTVNMDYQAGPFMSDFSSWGPTPDLKLKPEITAHGGSIKSAIPGGGYDELSGTSMATPNLCGIVVLIRQFLKEKFPDYTQQQIVVLANQMLMSTATIVLNEEGTPYSPRKQGAGLASLYNVVNTKAYLSVDGKDRAKLELGDDPERTGKYTMNFNVVNISDSNLEYTVDFVGMTETVSASDKDFVAETGQILGGGYSVAVENGSFDGGKINVAAGETAKVTVTYTLTAEDKNIIDSSFPNGMYVEGFVKLIPTYENGINLNIPFLAFYGDWTVAPMFDKTYYDVESEAHDDLIDDEDKIKADYFATTPYGSYFYNYIIPLGTYLYDLPKDYEAIPATKEHIAIGQDLATIDGISAVYGGLLRGAKTMTYTITDKVTGEVIKEFVDHNAEKASSLGGSPIPYYEYLNWKMRDYEMVNNRSYEFKMTGLLDYGDGGYTTNLNNTFSFDFTFDNEAPIIKSVTYEKEYDSTTKKDRYYLTMVVYDNHYVQSVMPIIFNSSSSYTTLGEGAIPVYSVKGADNRIRIDITDYLDDVFYDALITSSLAFVVDDYALNQNIFLCQLPGTRGDFKFTKNGETDGSAMTILTVYEDEVVDLTDYLATSDLTVDDNKDYLKYLRWTSSDEDIAVVEQGQVLGLKAGRSTICVTEQMNLKKAYILINVKAREDEAQNASVDQAQKQTARSLSLDKAQLDSKNNADHASETSITDIRFSYFDTKFAYSRAAQTSEIGSTGGRMFINSLNGSVSFYPGESIELHYDVKPWYAKDNYEYTYSSTDETVAKVDQNGLVTGLKEGSTTISLSVKGSNLIASLVVVIKDPFIIDDARTLVAYKGLGGKVVIPDDEGILYIGPYAFCLYDTDNTIEVTDEDFDKNKIPQSNTSVTEVVIPDGVEDIKKYAFYNCSGLKKVTIPSSVKYVREYSFYNDVKLEEIDLSNVYTIGPYAFHGCEKLDNINVAKAYAMGERAFMDCKSLSTIDVTALRNSGRQVFQGCEKLQSVTLSENTKLSYGMFARSGLKSVEIYEKLIIPEYCFAQCKSLESVTLNNDLVKISRGAFCENDLLKSVTFGKVQSIDREAFYDCPELESITLPDCEVAIGDYAFMDCEKLAAVTLGKNTVFTELAGSIFNGTALSSFAVPSDNAAYAVSADGKMLIDKKSKAVVFVAISAFGEVGSYTISDETVIGTGAFSGAKITELIITNPKTVIGDYAFAGCETLTKVVLPDAGIPEIGVRAFDNDENLVEVVNLDKVQKVGDYAFRRTKLDHARIAAAADYGEGVFFQSNVKEVTIGKKASFGLGAFQDCKSLTKVNMPAGGGVHFGELCFARSEALSVIDLSKTDGTIERQTFYGCTGLTTVDLAGVTTVGEYAFSDCYNIVTMLIPDVVTIGEGAFSRNAQYGGGGIRVTRIELPDTLTEIGEGAFIGCEYLTEITIPSSVTEIKDYTFAYCLRLNKVTLPASVKSIGKYAIAGCSELETVNLENVEEIADYAFTSSTYLGEIDLSSAKTIGFGSFADTHASGNIVADNLVKIGDYAFQAAWLDSFKAKNLKEIGIAAFQNNRKLEEFVFSTDIEKIGPLAFNGCAKLESFYFASGEEKVNDGEINSYAMLDDGILYLRKANGDLMLESVPSAKKMETLTVLERTTSIDLFAGNENKSVKYIVLPDSLKSINNYAFYGYTALESVEFRSRVAPALEDTLNAAQGLPNLAIPSEPLDEDDPGYELLHNQFDLFGTELCYFNFIDLAGKREPIFMILPRNSNISGYDAVVYEAYFGKVADAVRSEYVAMDENLDNFLTYAKEIAAKQELSFNDEPLVDEAIAALKATDDSGVNYGYTEQEWQDLIDTVQAAKRTLAARRGENVDPEPEPETPEDGSALGAIIVVVVVVLLGVALIVYIAIKNEKEEKEEKAHAENADATDTAADEKAEETSEVTAADEKATEEEVAADEKAEVAAEVHEEQAPAEEKADGNEEVKAEEPAEDKPEDAGNSENSEEVKPAEEKDDKAATPAESAPTKSGTGKKSATAKSGTAKKPAANKSGAAKKPAASNSGAKKPTAAKSGTAKKSASKKEEDK